MQDNEIISRAQAWATNEYFDSESRAEIKKLIDSHDTKELKERFYRDLEFGTGGLRSILGAGTNRMNQYNVRKASQALAMEVLKNYQGSTPAKICISYDSRRFSSEFAQEAASVFAAHGIHAYVFKRLNPVAMLSFAVRHFSAQAGVMVTASHNPPEYNGYKVFWNDGAQVTPPFDKNIIQHYNALTNYADLKFLPFVEAEKKGLIHWMGEETEEAYYQATLPWVPRPEMCLEHGHKLKIVYTPIHGAGLIPCTSALKRLGFKSVEVVQEQAQPDGRFPTVKSPNPENPSALKMAVDLMQTTQSDIAFGSDPDTDRLGVALFHQGAIQYLNGNQIGLLKLHYILSTHKEKGTLPSKGYFVKTIVTSPLQDEVAKKFGVEVFNTLTGFKWICGKMNELERSQPEKKFLFATEESFGYLSHNQARDKDGISSVTLMAEVALYYKLQGLNLIQALDKIYEEFGFAFEELLSLDYFGIEGQDKIARIMQFFRNYSERQMLNRDIESIKDYEKSLEGLPKSNVLGFIFKDGNQVYLRPSGTEPKIKFYIMIQERTGSLAEKKEKAYQLANSFVDYIKKTCEQL